MTLSGEASEAPAEHLPAAEGRGKRSEAVTSRPHDPRYDVDREELTAGTRYSDLIPPHCPPALLSVSSRGAGTGAVGRGHAKGRIVHGGKLKSTSFAIWLTSSTILQELRALI
jgi:hypothetical protein